MDHYDLQNAVREANQYTDEAKRDLDYSIDDLKREMQSEVAYLQRQIDALKFQIREIANR